MKSNYSLVIPAYNSSDSIIQIVEIVLQQLDENFEIIIVNDNSPNEMTWKTIKALAAKYKEVKGINLAKNFGQQAATICGMRAAKGDYVITMDDDMQHNPMNIIKLLSERDHDIVIGNLTNRKDKFSRRITSSIKGYFDHLVFGKPKGLGLSSFRMFNRRVVNEILDVNSPKPFLPALMFFVTSDVVNVDIEHLNRLDGVSNYTFSKRLKLFSLIIIDNSSIILKYVGYLGLSSLLFSAFLFLYFILTKLFFKAPPVGWTSLFSAVLFFGGFTLFSLGLIGEYLIRIIPIVEKRKPYIIKETTD